MTTAQVLQLIGEFRKILTPDAVSTDSLGSILEKIVGIDPASRIPSASTGSAGLLSSADYKRFSDAASKADRLETDLSNLETKHTDDISGITQSIGAKNGIAPLGADSRVPAGHIDLTALNVQEFSGFVEDAEITLGSAMGTPAIVFNRATSTFVAKTYPGAVGGAIGTPPVYYPNWAGREDTDAGTPRENTVYIDVTTDIPYRWNGEELVPIAMPLGEEEGTAFPGNEGAQMKEDVSIWKGRTQAALAGVNSRHPKLSESEDIVPEQYADPETHNTTHYLSLTDRAKQHLFDDLWIAAVGTHGGVDHTYWDNDGGVPTPYLLNGLWLEYDEAVAVYQAGAIDTTKIEKRYFALKIRTNLPPVIGGQIDGETAEAFDCLHICDESDIEVLNLAIPNNSIGRKFRLSPDCRKGSDRIFEGPMLREIIGTISLYGTEWDQWRIFGRCPELETVNLILVHNDMDMQFLPKISAASLRLMITKSTRPSDSRPGQRPNYDTPVITFTVHPDVYAKLTAHLDPEAEGYADRDTDWDDLLDLAATHKITFASA